jgi:hypothetical protein
LKLNAMFQARLVKIPNIVANSRLIASPGHNTTKNDEGERQAAEDRLQRFDNQDHTIPVRRLFAANVAWVMVEKSEAAIAVRST